MRDAVPNFSALQLDRTRQFSTTTSSQGLSSDLQADAVVLGIDVAPPHPHVGAAVDVDPVIVQRGDAAHLDVLDADLLAIPVFLHPGRAVLERDVPHGDVGAMAEIDDERPLTFLGIGQRAFLHQPLRVRRQQFSLPVDHAVASDGDVLLLGGQQQRVVVVRLIIHPMRAAEQRGAGFQVQRHMAFKVDRPAQIGPRRKNHRAGACARRGVDGLLDRLRIHVGAIPGRAVTPHVKFVRRMLWSARPAGAIRSPAKRGNTPRSSLAPGDQIESVSYEVDFLHFGNRRQTRCKLACVSNQPSG